MFQKVRLHCTQTNRIYFCCLLLIRQKQQNSCSSCALDVLQQGMKSHPAETSSSECGEMLVAALKSPAPADFQLIFSAIQDITNARGVRKLFCLCIAYQETVRRRSCSCITSIVHTRAVAAAAWRADGAGGRREERRTKRLVMWGLFSVLQQFFFFFTSRRRFSSHGAVQLRASCSSSSCRLRHRGIPSAQLGTRRAFNCFLGASLNFSPLNNELF